MTAECLWHTTSPSSICPFINTLILAPDFLTILQPLSSREISWFFSFLFISSKFECWDWELHKFTCGHSKDQQAHSCQVRLDLEQWKVHHWLVFKFLNLYNLNIHLHRIFGTEENVNENYFISGGQKMKEIWKSIPPLHFSPS